VNVWRTAPLNTIVPPLAVKLVKVTVAPAKLVVALEAVRLPSWKFPVKTCVPLVLVTVPAKAPAAAFVIPVTDRLLVLIASPCPVCTSRLPPTLKAPVTVTAFAPLFTRLRLLRFCPAVVKATATVPVNWTFPPFAVKLVKVTVAPAKLVVALEAVRLPSWKFPVKTWIPLVLVIVPAFPAAKFVVPPTLKAFVVIDSVWFVCTSRLPVSVRFPVTVAVFVPLLRVMLLKFWLFVVSACAAFRFSTTIPPFAVKFAKLTVAPSKVVVLDDSRIFCSVKFPVKVSAPAPPVHVPVPDVTRPTEQAALPLVTLPVDVIVAFPPIVIPRLFVASVRLAPLATVRSLLSFRLDAVTTTPDAVPPSCRYPICVVVAIVVPGPVITIVLLPGVPNVPLTLTLPDAVIVSVPVLVIVPELVKLAHPTVDPPPENVMLPVFVIACAPAAIDPAAPTVTFPAKLESAPSVSVCVPTATVDRPTVVIPSVIVTAWFKVSVVPPYRLVAGP